MSAVIPVNVIKVPLVMVILVLILMSVAQNNTIAVILLNVLILKVRAPLTDFSGTRLNSGLFWRPMRV